MSGSSSLLSLFTLLLLSLSLFLGVSFAQTDFGEFGQGVGLNAILFAMDYFYDSNCTLEYLNASTTITSSQYCTQSVFGTYFTAYSRSSAASYFQGSYACPDSTCTDCPVNMYARQGTCIKIGTDPANGATVYGLPSTVLPTTFQPTFFRDSACKVQTSSLAAVKPNVCQKVPGAVGYYYLAAEVFVGNISVASNCTTPSCTGCSFDYVSQTTCVPLGGGVYAQFSAGSFLSINVLVLILALFLGSIAIVA